MTACPLRRQTVRINVSNAQIPRRLAGHHSTVIVFDFFPCASSWRPRGRGAILQGMRCRALVLCLRHVILLTLLPACGAAGKSAVAEWTEVPDEKSRPIRETETFGAPPPSAASPQGGAV